MEKQVDYGKLFNKAVAHKKVLRKHFAVMLGLSVNHFYTLCNGERKPSLDTLIKTAEICSVELSTLIRWGEE